MNHKKIQIEAVIVTLFLLGALFLAPASSLNHNDISNSNEEQFENNDLITDSGDQEYCYFDQRYDIENPRLILGQYDNDDAGHKQDAGDEWSRADEIYPGELEDDTPGRGRTGKLTPTTDPEDWYEFSVCQGQTIAVTMTPPPDYDYDLGLWDPNQVEVATSTNSGSTQESISFVATETSAEWKIRIHYISGDEEAQYQFDVELQTQNDANSGDDAADTFADAYEISEGTYTGYLDMDDPYDFYKFYVTSGQGIHFYLRMEDFTHLCDFDISLYNPDGDYVYEEDLYYDDELWYPTESTGWWRVKIDIYPGWVDCPQPTEWNYYSYGSGAYELEFILETSAPDPPAPIPQPNITPIAKTFIITNDPETNRDEYGYLASIPACNYLQSEDRFLAPIIYEGDNTPTEYHGVDEYRGIIDDTTNYFLDDWNAYLDSYGKTGWEYTVLEDPAEAAAEIASQHWTSSDVAVVAIDGSVYEDTVKTVVSKTRTLRREVEMLTIPNDSPDIVELGGFYGYSMNIQPKWCAINVSLYGVGGAEPSLNAVVPHFMPMGNDWWPHPYDGDGPKYDLYFPLTRLGVWSAATNRITGDWDFEITKLAGDRHRFWVRDSDASLHFKVETDDPSDVLLFLVDPQGHLRAPDIPYWNGPVNPIHVWNGCHFDPSAGGFDPWRDWVPELHTEFTAEVLHPEKGLWTAIVVPRHAEGDDVTYSITGEVAYTNTKRADAAISAANAAVIASQEHLPLLYVTEDSVPQVTEDCFDDLGVQEVIFVERGDIGENVKNDLPDLAADLTTTQEIVDYVKSYDHSENYITITTVKHSTGESTARYDGSESGYWAQAANIGAYHCSPVLRIGDAAEDGILRTKVNPAGIADRIETWRLWEGDYYHGSRSCGHLPIHDQPINGTSFQILIQMLKYLMRGEGELPPFGLDTKRYWNEELHDGIYNYINSLGLDLEGQEGYCFVAPRKHIYIPAHHVMMGNNSYAGHIPGYKPAYTAAVIARSLLYSAVIFANPNRNFTTLQQMNYPDGDTWRTNDGQTHTVCSSREIKKSFGSHGRTVEGHCFWRAHLERMNDGVGAMYYSGHGTGGSGVSAQYEQTEFCNFPEQVWWDAWRGYRYDNWQFSRENGQVWYNPSPSMLYDLIHFDYNDELFGNLRSNAVFWMSCTTADANGPMVYLDHGAVLYYGNAGSGLRVEGGLQDLEFFKDTFIDGEPIGPAYSKQVWLHYRDFTTKDPTSMYGPSSLYGSDGITTIQCIYGDPLLIVYSPEWTSPLPVDP
jgi:hypothetical protein